jgi:SAM-dependent methyltransferase
VTLQQRFARLAAAVVSRHPWLWALFRRRLVRAFDTLAPVWEEQRLRPTHLESVDAALDRIASAPARALDVGTGTGVAARAVAARWTTADVLGIDASSGMIREARARGGRERYEVAHAGAVPAPAAAFDLVTMLNAIPFFDEIARVTAPGGHVVVAYSRGASTPIWVPLDRVRHELERRGFLHVADIAAGEGRALLAVREPVS